MHFRTECVLDWYCHSLCDLTPPVNKNNKSIFFEKLQNRAAYRFFLTLSLLLVLPYGLNSLSKILSSRNLKP